MLRMHLTRVSRSSLEHFSAVYSGWGQESALLCLLLALFGAFVSALCEETGLDTCFFTNNDSGWSRMSAPVSLWGSLLFWGGIVHGKWLICHTRSRSPSWLGVEPRFSQSYHSITTPPPRISWCWSLHVGRAAGGAATQHDHAWVKSRIYQLLLKHHSHWDTQLCHKWFLSFQTSF